MLYMSKLVAIRLPDELAGKLDARCSIRKLSKTEILIEAIERGWDDRPPVEQRPPAQEQVAAPAKPSMEYLRAICAGKLPGPDLEPEPEPAQVRMCTYKEYDSETGEWYGCALPEHGPKTRHRRGPAL